jgi:uracil-DNA glycosylase family 4
MFTGDQSGAFLFAALYRAGYANQATSVSKDDGLCLQGAYITAAVRCAPPANKPTPEERDRCRPFLVEELSVLRPRVLLCLGAFAYGALQGVPGIGEAIGRPRPAFGHGREVPITLDGRPVTILCSFHPSQQNVFTRRLTAEMLDAVLERAKELGGAP